MPYIPATTFKDCFFNVQAMRAVAALLVVLGHTLALGNMELPRFLGGGLIHTFAYAGVDIFFVISGFVICSAASKHVKLASAESGHRFATAFLLRRVFRIYPLYWLLFSVALLWAFLFTPALIPQTREGLFGLYLLLERHNPILSPAWSLVYEMYFYLCTAVMLLISRQRFMILLSIWFFITSILIFFADKLGVERSLFADPLILEFGLGCLIYFLLVRGHMYAAPFAIAFGLFFFFWGAQQTLQHGLLPPMPRVQSFGIGSALLLYGLIGLEHKHRFMLPQFLIALGGVSYSIYLVHKILIDMAMYAVGRLQISLQGHALLASCLMLMMVIGVSFVLYRLVEKPAMRLGISLAASLERVRA